MSDTNTRQCPTCQTALGYRSGIGHRRDPLVGRYYVGGWYCQACESGWCEDEEQSRDSAACECVAGQWCDVCTHEGVLSMEENKKSKPEMKYEIAITSIAPAIGYLHFVSTLDAAIEIGNYGFGEVAAWPLGGYYMRVDPRFDMSEVVAYICQEFEIPIPSAANGQPANGQPANA